MTRSRGPSPICLAYHRAIAHYPRTAEARREWETLWAAHTAGDVFVNISIDDAIRLAELGWGLAAENRNWEAARERVLRCTRHPDWALAGEIDRQFVLSRVAAGHLLLGERGAAITGYRDLLAMRRPYHTS